SFTGCRVTSNPNLARGICSREYPPLGSPWAASIHPSARFSALVPDSDPGEVSVAFCLGTHVKLARVTGSLNHRCARFWNVIGGRARASGTLERTDENKRILGEKHSRRRAGRPPFRF